VTYRGVTLTTGLLGRDGPTDPRSLYDFDMATPVVGGDMGAEAHVASEATRRVHPSFWQLSLAAYAANAHTR
jgi:hypothetical protein